jgi:hypothetical protein
MITLAEYREMINELAQDPGVFDPRESARMAVAERHGRDVAERIDRRYYREVYLAD